MWVSKLKKEEGESEGEEQYVFNTHDDDIS